jgi:hypothetical protein
MKNQAKKGIVGGVGFAMVALALAGTPAFAADPAADSTSVSDDLAAANPSMTAMTHATVTITKINKGTRHLTVKKPDGGRQTFQVPPEIASFDKLKVGDKVDIDYGERIALQVLPAGTKPSESEAMAVAPGMVGQTAKVSAEVVGVDPTTNHVTFKGPDGDVETVAVQDPALRQKLPSLEPGQVVQLTFTQAIVGAIQLHGSRK